MTADRLDAALADLEATTEWLLQALGEGRIAEALAGATALPQRFSGWP